MKQLFTAFFILLGVTFAQAQFVTPGDGTTYTMDDLVDASGGVVTFEGDSYHIHNDLTISASDVLEILEDLTVKTASGKRIIINGTLIVDPPEEVIFTAINPMTPFLGFRFDGATNNTLMRNAIVEYAGGMQLLDTDMLFDTCTIRYFDMSNTSAAINLFNSSPVIKNSVFLENAGAAIGSGANIQTSPQILNNSLISNGTANTNRPQINLGPSAADTLKIVGNYIEGEYTMAGAIAVSNSFAVGNTVALIEDNVMINNRYGVTIQGGSITAIIHNNQIIDNNIQGQPMLGGSGINLVGSATNMSYIKNNIISGNLWGITIQNNAQANIGEIGNELTGYNVFEDNGNSGIIYALYNNTPGAIMAQNNYWGTDDESVAADYIVDQADDPSLGPVTFLPIWVPENLIESFVLEAGLNDGLNEDYVAEIDQEEQSIHLILPAGTNLSALVPTIDVSLYASINPPSGTLIDLSEPVEFTVTSFTGEERNYTISAETEGPELFTVVFNVEVGILDFDPEVHHVIITGTMTDWAEPGTDPDLLMEKISDEPLKYSKTFLLEAGEYEYKYFSNYFGEGWDGGEWQGDPNRVIIVTGDMTIEDFISGPAYGSVTFEIFDLDGNGITDAVVTLGNNTNQPGDYYFGLVEPGSYDYIVEKDGFFDAEGTVFIVHYDDVTETVTMTPSDVSTMEPVEISTNIFPNPASGRFNITSSRDIDEIQVIDLLGKTVYFTSVSGNEHTVDLSDFRPGIYFVRVTSEGQMQTHRLQVVR